MNKQLNPSIFYDTFNTACYCLKKGSVYLVFRRFHVIFAQNMEDIRY